MKTVFLVYPHQLFENLKCFKGKKVLLIEEPLFFTQYEFHIQKLILHRASMKFYENYLKVNNIEVEYYEDESYLEFYKDYFIELFDVADDWLLKKIRRNFKKINISSNPNFLNVIDNTKFLHSYYQNRRKELNILFSNGKPVGGKWSFDQDNRKKLSKNPVIPKVKIFDNIYVKEAKKYCNKFQVVGECDSFYYPTTFDEAKENFDYFLKEKFSQFGDYQDAIEQNHTYMYHSNISSSLNIGLLDFSFVIENTLKQDVALNAKEGFIRQLIGWREFMFSIYKSSHITLRTTNYFKFTNKLPPKLLSGSSGLKPIDDVINKLNLTAYNHHIERLMVLGNIFLLLEIDPNEVYEFFMKNYIDGYDWVMVANVYGMSGFSDGGSITTKPYISSSNYILKMSNSYSKKDEWCQIWDGLYWRFLYKYRDKLQTNIRMKMQYALLDKIAEEKLQEHLFNANSFIEAMK